MRHAESPCCIFVKPGGQRGKVLISIFTKLCIHYEVLELIGFKWHLDKYGNTYADWDTASCSDTQQLLASITNFEFIVVFFTVYQYLSHLAGTV